MSQALIALSYWLHALATVIFIGHFVLLALVYIPALADDGAALSKVSKRSRPWLYTALVIFFVTGIYLMVADPNYLGIGGFGNVWGVTMLIKHVLVLAMIVMGFWFNAIQRVGPAMLSNTGAAAAVGRFRRYANLMAITGVLVLLLTAVAQAQ